MKGNINNRKYLIWFWSLFTFPFVLIIILFILISREKLGPMPTFKELENPEYYLAAEVFSEDGVLLGKISIENLTWTDYKDLSPYLTEALIATEDIRYYRHSGIDIRGLARAGILYNSFGSEHWWRKYYYTAACQAVISQGYGKNLRLYEESKAGSIQV